MKKSADRIIFLFSIIFLIAVIASILNSGKSEICFKKECFEVELAVTDEEQTNGLSGREELGEDKGMLFIMERDDIHPFWMKDMLFSLDIIWVSGNETVVDLIENAEPCGVPICIPIIPHAKAKYVLEVNNGTVEKINLSVNDKLEIKIRN